jgi:two-component system response regulator YesN
MYKILLVDDEQFIREKTPFILNWKSIGFDIVKTLSCSEEALVYLENNDVDVLLTDIKMAKISGIELAKIVKDKYPKIITILLSGYSDFEYAREAMKYGVRHYLIKPADIDDIEEVFQEIRKELDDNHIISQNEAILFAKWFNDFISSDKSEWENERLKVEEAELDISLKASKVAEVVFKIIDFKRFLDSQWSYGKQTLVNVINTILRYPTENIYSYCTGICKNECSVFIIEKNNNDKKFEDIIKNETLRIIKESSNIIGIELVENKIGYFDSIIQWISDFDNLEIPKDQIINIVKEQVAQNYNQDLTLADLASNLYVSNAYLSKLFRKEQGQNFIDYLISYRMEKAKDLLVNTNMLVGDICTNVGYANIKHFYKIFRSYAGMNATEYRNINKN